MKKLQEEANLQEYEGLEDTSLPIHKVKEATTDIDQSCAQFEGVSNNSDAQQEEMSNKVS